MSTVFPMLKLDRETSSSFINNEGIATKEGGGGGGGVLYLCVKACSSFWIAKLSESSPSRIV